jgi:hypothetical protein
MPRPEIEQFVKILVREVRDAAIRSNDLRLRPDVTHAIAKRWRESAQAGQLEPIAKTLIPDVVDDTIFYLLHAIDEGLLQLSFTDSNGQTVNLNKEGHGELGGWFAGEWCKKYTKERFIHDFTHL